MVVMTWMVVVVMRLGGHGGHDVDGCCGDEARRTWWS